MTPVNSLPSEKFISFLEMKDHSGIGMADLVHKYLTIQLQSDCNKCRGQSCDNAAYITVKYAAKIPRKKEICKIYSMRR